MFTDREILRNLFDQLTKPQQEVFQSMFGTEIEPAKLGYAIATCEEYIAENEGK